MECQSVCWLCSPLRWACRPASWWAAYLRDHVEPPGTSRVQNISSSESGRTEKHWVVACLWWIFVWFYSSGCSLFMAACHSYEYGLQNSRSRICRPIPLQQEALSLFPTYSGLSPRAIAVYMPHLNQIIQIFQNQCKMKHSPPFNSHSKMSETSSPPFCMLTIDKRSAK